jgi:hypothetical protein
MDNNYDNDIVYYGNNIQVKSEFTDTILLKYTSNGDTRTGIIKIKRAINTRKEEIEYLGIEYSDDGIKSYVETNPSVLAKIDDVRNRLN